VGSPFSLLPLYFTLIFHIVKSVHFLFIFKPKKA
jgi:hypothetical protein